MARTSSNLVDSRVHEIVRLLLAGAELDDVREFANQQSWNVSRRQLQRYVERAYQQLVASSHRDREKLLARHLAQRRAMYARAMKAGDMRTALHILRDEAALQGLYPPTKVAPTSPDGEQSYAVYAIQELLQLADQAPSGPIVIDAQVLRAMLESPVGATEGSADEAAAGAQDGH